MSMWTRAAIVFALLMTLAITARALPPLPKYVEEHYASGPSTQIRREVQGTRHGAPVRRVPSSRASIRR